MSAAEERAKTAAAVAALGALPMPVGPGPQTSVVETLEKRTGLLRIVQATARRQAKEIAGRKVHGDRLKAENTEMTADLYKAKAYVRAVERLLTERTPFAPRGQEATLLAIGWLRESLDSYRGRVDSAEVFARRTQARINALLVEPLDLQGCALCGASEDGHGVRVTEGFEHEWTRPTDALVRERRLMRQQLERSAAGEPAVSELMWLRARVAELEAKVAEYAPVFPWAALMDHKDLTEFLDELAASAITHASSEVALAEVEKTCATWRLIAEAQHAHNTAPGPDAGVSADKLTAFFAPVASLREDPHDGPPPHRYEMGRDLPETGGDR